ncbi:MAG: hypothetical protein JW929_09815, partial [Anaerolineales bacterium]|nr:hypothetical protein [Anaerolineales bacterium]
MHKTAKASSALETKNTTSILRTHSGVRREGRQAITPSLSAAGNQAFQRLLQERAILPKLEIGSPNDPQEREAEAAAECLANGIPCNNCIGPSFH